MGIFNKFNKNIEKRSLEYYPFALQFASNTSYRASKALTLSAVYRCVQILSDSVAALPLEPFKVKNGYKRKMVESEIYPLLTCEPNEFSSKFMMFKNLVAQLLLKGNAYVLIERKGTTITNLRLLHADQVQIVVTNDDIKYKYIPGDKLYNKADIIHVINYSEDGIHGQSVIQHAVNSLQLSSDSEAHARGFFRGGANMAGFIKTTTVLLKEKAEALKTSFMNAFNPDAGNPNGIAILDNGSEFVPVTVNPVDSQLLETRKFNVIDICRFFGVHPSKVFDTSSSTYSNVENYQLAFLTDTLTPLLEKIENEFHRKLFLPSERATIELKFDVANLLRADSLSQADYYTKMYQLGVFTTNEIRQKLNLPAVSGGDQAFIQVNLMPIDRPVTDLKTDNKFK